MIRIETANTNPSPLNILAVASQNIGNISSPLTERDKDACCSCSFVCGCTYMEYAFGGSNDYESDRTQRFAAKQLASDTVTIELWKNCAKTADLNDNTYGTFYDGVGINALYVGYEVEWSKVLGLKGGGIYFIKFIMNIAGVSFERETHKFRCMAFDACAASTTVRVESVINLNIDAVFNYVGMNQRLWVRVKGSIGNKQAVVEDEEYLTSGRSLLDFQTKTPTTYDLQLKAIPAPVFNLVIYEMMVAEIINISSYQLPFFESFVSIAVKRDSYEEAFYSDNGTKVNQLIKLKPRKDLPIGRIS